ncbi:hypothetical protein JTB14_001643 [Gonioctena quinquepunctata]|nr:hypothetical protein JTB14_001643 [Gonioctena quinquepunctata]
MPLTSSQIEETLSTRDDCITSLLSNILNLHLQSQDSEGIVMSAINKLLSVSKSRSEGLEYLNLVINNCSNGIIHENALNWMSHCLVKYSGDNLKEIKLETIGRITDIAHKDPEFTKKFVSEYMSKVLEMCLSPHMNDYEMEAALETLSICMKRYASWFTSHKVKIETFLVKCLDSSSESIVKKAAVAFHYLQQVGGAGVDGINHINNFSMSFHKLCATAHNLFDVFFENETEFEQFSRTDVDGFEFDKIALDSQKMLHVLARRIKNCITFIQTMLIKGFPVAKEIKPIEVLNIISRGTMIHQCLTSTDTEKSLADYQFSLLLNNLQINLLQLLRIFIIWSQANSLPFSFIISKILTDCLKKSQNCDCFSSESLYQEAVYKVLQQWIRISKCSLHPHFQSQLVSCILKDITPLKTNLTLSIKAEHDGNKSKRAKRKAVQERIISSGLDSSHFNKILAEKNNQEEKCSLALDTLKHLLTASFLKIETSLLKELYSSVIGTLMEISTSKFSNPYTNTKCQAKLYEVLGAFYEQDTLQILPPLQLTLDLFTEGSNHNNRLIAVTCEQSLSNLEKLCQPVCPSLYSPQMFETRQTEVQEEQIFDEQVINNIASTDSGTTLELWCATTSQVEPEVEDSQSAPKINIQDVKILKTSTTELLSPVAEETNGKKEIKSGAEENDLSGAVQDTAPAKDVSVSTEETERNDLKCNNDMVIQEAVDFNSGPPETENDDIGSQANNPLSNSDNIVVKEVDTPLTIPREAENDVLETVLKNEVLSDGNIRREVSEEVPDSEPRAVDIKITESYSIKTSTSGWEFEGEPPLKKVRSGEECVEDLDVKEEVKSSEEVDDEFHEEDSFVDVVKDY